MMEIAIELGEIEKFIGKYSLGRDNGEGSLHFLRIKIPAGQITSDKLREIAKLSRKYGRGYAEITDRQDIQLHWIDSEKALEIFEELYKLGYTTDLCGQGLSGACYGDVRNIVSCPLSGKISDFDVAKHAKELTEFFSGNPEFIDLPRKFKIAFTGCGGDCVRLGINDLGMYGIELDGRRGFVPFVGGSIGASHPGPSLAKNLGVFVPEERVFEFVKAVVEIHRDHSSRESKAKARFKNLVNSWGIEKLRSVIEEKIGKLERIEGIELNYAEHNGSGEQINGLHYYTLPVVGGVLNAEKLDFIADMADKHGEGEVRLTPQQNVTFVDVKDVEKLKRDLEKKFQIKEGYVYYNSIACASNFCGKTRDVHAKDLLKKLIEVCEKRGVRDVRINVSGCHNDCGCVNVAEFGFMARMVRKNGKVVQGYDIYIGGDFTKLKMSKPYKTGLTVEEVIEEFEKLISR